MSRTILDAVAVICLSAYHTLMGRPSDITKPTVPPASPGKAVTVTTPTGEVGLFDSTVSESAIDALHYKIKRQLRALEARRAHRDHERKRLR